jgi:hypothetical protein
MKIINETIVDANPVVWSAEIQSANGDLDSIAVTSAMMVSAPVGTEFSVAGGGNLWSKSIRLKIIFKTENVVVCEEAYHYSDNQRETKDVQIHFFRI